MSSNAPAWDTVKVDGSWETGAATASTGSNWGVGNVTNTQEFADTDNPAEAVTQEVIAHTEETTAEATPEAEYTATNHHFNSTENVEEAEIDVFNNNTTGLTGFVKTFQPKFKMIHEARGGYITAIDVQGRSFGRAHQLSLGDASIQVAPVTRVVPYSAPGLPGRLQFKIQTGRLFDNTTASINPAGEEYHTMFIDLWCRHMKDFRLAALTADNCPASFKTLDPAWATQLGGKYLMSFTHPSDKMVVVGTGVPVLSNTTLQSSMEAYAEHIASLYRGENTMINFSVVIEERFLPTWELFADRVADPKDIIFDWVYKSPDKHALLVGSIQPLEGRPEVECLGWVAAKQYSYDNPLDMAVPHVYNEVDKATIARTVVELIKDHPFQATLTAVPGSHVKRSPADNDLPKCYYSIIDIRNSPLEKPKPGDMLRGYFPDFLVPDCQSYKGDNPKRVREDNDPYAELMEDGYYNIRGFDDNGELIQRPQGKKPDEDETAELLIKTLQTMTGYVDRSDIELPEGHIHVVWLRPLDSRWLGPKGQERSVDTIYPSADVVATSKKDMFAALKASPTYNVALEPAASTQEFKDTIRCFDAFCRKDRANSKTNTTTHLADYVLAFDERLQFHTFNYFVEFAPPDFEERLSTLTFSQRKAFKTALMEISHGLVTVYGVVASSKTFVSVLMCVMPLAKSLAYKTVMVQQTNMGADALAAMAKKEVDRQNIKNVLIIRIGSLSAEKNKFTAKYLPPRFLASMGDVPDEIVQFTSTAYLNKRGLATEGYRKAGDKRFTESCRDLYLHEAMMDRFERLKGTDYVELDRLITEWTTNSSTSSSMIELTARITTLRNDTLKSAHIIATTPAQAKRYPIHTIIGDCTFFLEDEAGSRPAIDSMSLMGVYEATCWILNGDLRQPGPFNPYSFVPEFWGVFQATNEVTLLERAKKRGVKNQMILDEQLRMYTASITVFVSSTFYNGVLTDAHKQGIPIQVEFIKGIHNKLYGVDRNVCMVDIRNSRHDSEAGSTSIYNKSHVALVLREMRLIQSKLNDVQDFDTANFKVAHISWYKAQSEMVQAMIDTDLADPRFCSMTIPVSRGVTVDHSILDLAHGACINKFASTKDLFLVGLTRQRYGLTILKSKRTTEPETYELTRMVELRQHPTVKNWATLTRVCQNFGQYKEVEAPKLKECNNCHSLGHLAGNCPLKFKGCHRCGATDHKSRECSRRATRPAVPTINPATKDESGNNKKGKTCNICNSSTHLQSEVVHCIVCKICNDHATEQCEHAVS